LRKYLQFTLLLFVAVAILWFFGQSLDWQEVGASLRAANPYYLLAAALITCLGYYLRAARWKVLLEPLTPTALGELFAATTVGFAVIAVVGRAGELARPMWLSMRDRRVRPSAALVTLGVERIFDLAALVCFFAVNLLWFKAPAERETEFAYIRLLGIAMLVGVAAGFVALLCFQKHFASVIGWFERLFDKKFIPKRLQRLASSIMRQTAASLEILRDGREIAGVCFWTILLWLSIALPTWFVILAFDLPVKVGFADSLFVMGFAAIGSVVPTPGGAAGAFHAATLGGLVFLGVEKNDAAAVSVAMHIVYFAPALFFGLYYFLRGGVSLARLRALISGEYAAEEVVHETDGDPAPVN
jgi:uncharacterized protein (TIRG00374 family)